jgi:DNA-binding MarR family transcriptional regulator
MDPPMSMQEIYGKPGHLIRRAHQIAVALFMEECGGLDITPVQYAMLLAIRENPGVDATRLSALIAFDRSTLGSVLERLEARKLVLRGASPDDKRIKVLHLTPAGAALLRAAEPAVVRSQKRLLEPLPQRDRATLVTLLNELVRLNDDAAPAVVRSVGRQNHGR